MFPLVGLTAVMGKGVRGPEGPEGRLWVVHVLLGSLPGPLLLSQTFLLRTLSCQSSDSTGWGPPLSLVGWVPGWGPPLSGVCGVLGWEPPLSGGLRRPTDPPPPPTDARSVLCVCRLDSAWGRGRSLEPPEV